MSYLPSQITSGDNFSLDLKKALKLQKIAKLQAWAITNQCLFPNNRIRSLMMKNIVEAF